VTKVLRAIVSSLVVFTLGAYSGGKISVPTEDKMILKSQDISPLYLGIGFTIAKFQSCNRSNCSYEDQTYGAMLRAGYDINHYLGIEVRAIRTFWGEGSFGGVPLQHIGLFVKPQYPIGEHLRLYGLLGYGYTENLGNGARLNYFDNDYGFSAGLGLEYDLSSKDDANDEADSPTWSLFVDYQRLLIKSNAPDMDVVSLGVKYSF
jgi:opacity protein-like surface antigen